MSWQVIIEGQTQKATYDSEEEACQAAANARGTDWHKKIEVRNSSAPAEAMPEPAPAQPVIVPAGILTGRK